MLSNWDPGKTGPIPPGCRSLRRLSVLGGELGDLSAAGNVQSLEELHLTLCSGLKDLSGLSALRDLRAVTLTNCKGEADISPLLEGGRLGWLGLPLKVTQQELERVVRAQPDLRVLELVNCKEVTDLSPLKSLQELEVLVLLGLQAGYEPLHAMSNLRLVVLDKEAFDVKPDEVRCLEDALPEAQVVAGEPFCLGSGWIVALLPVMGSGALMSKRRRMGARAADEC